MIKKWALMKGEQHLDKYSAIVWPLLSQIISAAVVLSIRPTPQIELGIEESAGLSLFYVLIVLVTASLILLLIRKGMFSIIRLLTITFFAYSSFIAIDNLLYSLQVHWSIELMVAVIITWLSLRRDIWGNMAKSFLAASLAYLFVYFFNDLFIYFLLAGLAFYDAYSVFKGPLSKLLMVSKGKSDPLEPLMVFHGDISMGLGDVFCYSMASASSLRSLKIPLAFLPIVILNIGILITIWLLYRAKRSLPGLTIPIILWLAAQLTFHGIR